MPENEAAMQLAYRKGRTAYQHFKTASSNPYDPGSPYHRSWQEGWEAEKAATQKPNGISKA